VDEKGRCAPRNKYSRDAIGCKHPQPRSLTPRGKARKKVECQSRLGYSVIGDTRESICTVLYRPEFSKVT
jgi:hypothetical protein